MYHLLSYRPVKGVTSPVPPINLAALMPLIQTHDPPTELTPSGVRHIFPPPPPPPKQKEEPPPPPTPQPEKAAEVPQPPDAAPDRYIPPPASIHKMLKNIEREFQLIVKNFPLDL